MEFSPDAVRLVAGAVLIVAGAAFAMYARHALRVLTMLRAFRADRKRLQQRLDRLLS
ncbi:hypothetical protein FH063_003150 [Azospirillum argentinense]|uniref:Uncharacterized protein n=1 Tax=Azospirillum argentinense TaxID=2970906 RepID=A0A5B0KMV6_9PROT|nr:hypothetical protein FH063_003150 [Azospirillum argentinense]